MSDRTIPHDIPAERAVLGAILLGRDAVLAVSGRLQPDDFYLEKHALIYEAQLACLARRVPPDLATVALEIFVTFPARVCKPTTIPLRGSLPTHGPLL